MGYNPSDTNLALALALEGAQTGDAEIRRMVGVARLLESVPDPEIDPGFAARLEARLMTEDLRLVHAARPTPRPDEPTRTPEAEHRAAIIRLPRRRYVVRRAVAGLIAASLAMALPVVACMSALPGSPTYGSKIAIERWRIGLARGPVNQGFAWLDFAGRRLTEAQQLASLERDHLIPSTLALLESARAKGAALILGATTDRKTLAKAADQLQRQNEGLADLLPQVPLGARDDLLDAIRTGRALSLRVAAALGLPVIRPPATVAPSADAPDTTQVEVEDDMSGRSTWRDVSSGSATRDATEKTKPKQEPEGGDGDATYAPCVLENVVPLQDRRAKSKLCGFIG